MSDLLVIYALGCLLTFVLIGWNLDTCFRDYHMTFKTVVSAWMLIMFWPTTWALTFADVMWTHVYHNVKKGDSAK